MEKRGYEVSSYKRNGYHMLQVNLYSNKEWREFKQVGCIVYQSNEGDRYYGGSIDLRNANAEELNALNNIIRDIEKNCPGWSSNALALLKYLAGKYNQLVYDGRLSKYIKTDKVLPENVKRYMMLDKKGNCREAVLAESNKEAEKKLIKKVAEQLAGHLPDSYKKDYLEWLKEPKAIVDNYNPYPEWEPVEELINSLQKKTA